MLLNVFIYIKKTILYFFIVFLCFYFVVYIFQIALFINITIDPFMQNLNAFGRAEYVEAKKGPDYNPFIEIPNAKDEKSALLLKKSEFCYMVLNKFPYNAGHLLVIPFRKADRLDLLRPEERADIIEMITFAQVILQKALNPDGFNIGFNLGSAAGAGIPQHLHCHIVPRWVGDTNFMTVLDKTRIINQSPEEIWPRLKKFT
jgi:ATP adenylyltransferase